MNHFRMIKTMIKTNSAHTRNCRKEIKGCGKGISWAVRNKKDYSLDLEQMSQLQIARSMNSSYLRDLHLAYAYMKGKAYFSVENYARTKPDSLVISVILHEYGFPEMKNTGLPSLQEQVENWLGET